MKPLNTMLLCCAVATALAGCNTWTAVKQDAREVGQTAGRGVERAGQATGRGLEKAGEATGRGIEKAGEKIQVDVPVVVVGEPEAGTIANLDATSVALEVEATHIPEHVEVDVEGLEDGTHVTAADLKLPKGASLVAEGDVLVVAISVPAATLAAEDEIAEADAEVAAEQAEEAEEAKEAESE